MGAPGFSWLYPNLIPGPTVPGNMPSYDYPQAEGQQGPTSAQLPVPPIPPTGMPASVGGNQPPAAQSPFDEDAFWTPPQRPTGSLELEAQPISVRLMHSNSNRQWMAGSTPMIVPVSTLQFTRIPHRGNPAGWPGKCRSTSGVLCCIEPIFFQ